MYIKKVIDKYEKIIKWIESYQREHCRFDKLPAITLYKSG